MSTNYTKGAKPADIIAARMIDTINKGVAPWARPWRSQGIPRPCNGISKRPYNGMNFFVLSMYGHPSPYYFTGKKAVELGGKPAKGKGIPICYWLFPDKEKRAELIKAGKTPRPLLRYYLVWNESDIEGLPDAYKWTAPEAPTLPDGELNAAAVEALEAWFQRVPCRYGGDRAFYAPFEDRIQLPPVESFTSYDHFLHTAFHECAHSTGHADRLKRDFSGAFGSKAYAQEELVAELTASLMGAHYGFDVAGQDASYLKSWIAPLADDSGEIMKAASKAQKAFEMLVGLSWDDNSTEAPEMEES